MRPVQAKSSVDVMNDFLQECYVAAGRTDAASRALVRIKAAAADLSAEGHLVRLVQSILLPRDETWFLLWEADSAEVVREAARLAGIACDRVTEATRLPSALHGAARST